MNILVRSSLALVAAVSVAACQGDRLVTGPPAPDLQAYVTTPAHQTDTAAAAKLSGRWRALQCAQPAPMSPSQITYAAEPMTFGPDGTPTRGVWTERITTFACGQTMLLNVGWIANGGGKFSAGPMAPGVTRADPVLQTDAYKRVFLIAAAKVPPCGENPLFIYDTAVDATAPSPAPGSWKERWIISSCGKHVVVPIRFTPDGQGGAYLAVLGDEAAVE